MIQLRPGDLVEVQCLGKLFRFAVLTKQALFGGHWCYAFYTAESERLPSPGFNAFVDFIVPKREGRISRISRGNDFAQYQGPELLQQEPAKGEVNFRIHRWKNHQRQEVEYVRFTPSPTEEEAVAPRYSCIPADWVCELLDRQWNPRLSLWVA